MGPGDVGMEVELGDCMRYIDKNPTISRCILACSMIRGARQGFSAAKLQMEIRPGLDPT